MMNANEKVYVAGHTGLIGTALRRKLVEGGMHNIVVRTHRELDLTDQQAVFSFFDSERPLYVFFAAGKVGGIVANMEMPATFIAENLAMQMNVLGAAHRAGVEKLLFYGSSCSYPSAAPQPMKEESFLTGPLEATSEAYAVAKIAGIKMCQAYRNQYGCNFICAIPASAYGPNDNYDPKASHVIPGLIRRFYDARERNLPAVQIWGTGKPIRSFIYVDDLADASLFLMNRYDSPDIINIGSGYGISIRDLVGIIQEAVGYKGDVVYDATKVDGVPRKLLDMTKLTALGWKPSIDLKRGIQMACAWHRDHVVCDGAR